MGNTNTACQMSNCSRRNIRVFVTEKAQGIDAFLTSRSGGDDTSLSVLPGGKRFCFRKDIGCVRVLASQTQEVAWDAGHFLSVFVEDEEDENVCSKQIQHNMALGAPVAMVLYDL